MPQSLVKIIVHVVFSTKDRRDFIFSEIEAELFKYISSIIKSNGGRLIIANGTANLVHLLISIGRIDIGDLIGQIKRDSSLWVKKRFPDHRGFYWQRGYGAFSVGQSQIGAVSDYIRNQKIHHIENSMSFAYEFRNLCKKYKVEIDERYCWD